MKKFVSQTFVLVMLCSLSCAVGSDYWSRMPTEGEGDWAPKEAELTKTLEGLQEQEEALRVKIAENPAISEESRGESLARILTEESAKLEAARQEAAARRESAETEELEQVLKISREQAELEQKQRAEREAQEKEAQERAIAEQQALKAQREQKLKEEQEKLAQERLQAQQLQAEKERAQKQQEKLAAITWQKSSKPTGLVSPLQTLFAPQPKTPAQTKTPALSPEEAEMAAINAEIARAEEAAYQQKLKDAAPFFAAYEQAISPYNKLRIRIVRPEIIEQKELECGYYSAINGALLYNAFRSRKQGALEIILNMLNNPKKIGRLLNQAQNKLSGCPKTLEASDIISILNLYNIELGSGAYSMYYDQLPDSLRKLDASNKDIITVLQKLNTQKGFTHIFFLRKAGAHEGQSSLGHWISVVAHNVDNKRVDLYVLDSQYPQGDEATYKNTRFNHDTMWQALAILLHQENLAAQAAQERLNAPAAV